MDLTPPPGIDLNESQQAKLYAAYSITYALAVVAVALRFLCRLSIKRTALWWDDWMSLLALVRMAFQPLLLLHFGACYSVNRQVLISTMIGFRNGELCRHDNMGSTRRWNSHLQMGYRRGLTFLHQSFRL